MTATVYLSLGSNLGNREEQLREAISRLESSGRVAAVSSFYQTEPVEVAEQPWFLNCAVALETRKTPEQLIAAILAIEQSMGRQRVQDKGSRSIDIDILLFDQAIIDSNNLTVPHPAMHRRRFVLKPLAEIAPDAVHPILNKSVTELLDALPAGQAVEKQAKPAADSHRVRRD